MLLACAMHSHAAASAYPEGAHRRVIESVGEAESVAYRAALDAFDDHLNANPDDYIAAVERCRFIIDFAYREETTISSAYEESEACIGELSAGDRADLPEVQLFLLEQKWGEEAIREAEALLGVSDAWPDARLAALHARLSDLYAGQDAEKSGRHATIAAELDPASARQLAAAEYQVRIGAMRKATNLVAALPESEWNAWTLQRAVRALLAAGDSQAALALVREKSDIELDQAVRYKLARVLLDSGDVEGGSEMAIPPAAETAVGVSGAGYPALREFFEIKREHGQVSEALAAYDRLRDAGWRADPFGRYRLSLTAASPWSAWRARDLLGVGALVLVLMTIALLPGLLVAPIHYRSVTRQLHGFAVPVATELAPWSLRNMWYAVAAILTLMVLAAYVLAYPHFESMISPAIDAFPSDAAEVDNPAIGRAYLFGNALCLIAMIPLLRKSSWMALTATRWPIARALLLGCGAALGFLFIAGLIRGLFAWSGLGVGPGSENFRAMQGINEAFGPAATIGFACITTPLLEEFVFRGVVLRAGARHVSLWAAVLIQAVLFVIWHEDVGDYPVLFAFALCSAWLALRSGGLAASVAFHAVVNLVAVSTILRFSQSLNPAG